LNDQINGGNLNGSIQPASILSIDVAKFVFGRRPSSPPLTSIPRGSRKPFCFLLGGHAVRRPHHSPVYQEAASHFAFCWGTTPSVVPTTHRYTKRQQAILLFAGGPRRPSSPPLPRGSMPFLWGISVCMST